RCSTAAPRERNRSALAVTLPMGMCGSTSLQTKNEGVPSRSPTYLPSSISGPIRPPDQATTPPYRRGWRAAYSLARQAPWEKPSSTTRSRGMPVLVSAVVASAIAARAESSHGWLTSSADMKGYGYHTLLVAWRATYATPGTENASASPMMPEAESPRPWIMIIAARASDRGTPVAATMAPLCGPFPVCEVCSVEDVVAVMPAW